MDNTDILTQISFKKFGNEFDWLTFPDLKRIVLKYNDDVIDDDEAHIDVHSVRIILDKVHRVLLKINDIKLHREYSQNLHTETIEEIHPTTETFIDKNSITPVLSYKIFNVFVDSKDRDVERWPNINPFQFTLGPSSIDMTKMDDINSIFRSFSNVHAVTIKKVIIPFTEQLFPYLLLTINELGSNMNSTNNNASNSFGYLSQPQIINDFAYFDFSESYDTLIQSGQNTHMTKIFSPRIELSRLTFSISQPNGDILNFDDNEQSVVVEMQITCLRKELDNTIIMRPS